VSDNVLKIDSAPLLQNKQAASKPAITNSTQKDKFKAINSLITNKNTINKTLNQSTIKVSLKNKIQNSSLLVSKNPKSTKNIAKSTKNNNEPPFIINPK